MVKLAFIHKGSKTCRMLIEETGIPRYGRGVKPAVIVNYGVMGRRFRRWQELNPLGSRLPMFNYPVGWGNKFDVVEKVEREGVRVPESRKWLDERHNPSGWLEKPFYSQGGEGIRVAIYRGCLEGGYFQQYIFNRVYELRVHAFMWIPMSEWVVQKRVRGEGDEGVTWNYHTGGRFITVQDVNLRVFRVAVEKAERVLDVMEMQFGGVDFIVDEERRVFFIEVNSAVGCNGLSDIIYINAFKRLREMREEEVLGYVGGE